MRESARRAWGDLKGQPARPFPPIVSRYADGASRARVPLLLLEQRAQRAPHVHVSSGDGYAKFWLDPVSLAESVGYDAREVYVLQRLVVDDREKFATMWRDYFGA